MDTNRSDIAYLTRDDIIDLNDKEKHLIRLLRDIAYGRVTIFMEKGIPVRVDEIKETIKL